LFPSLPQTDTEKFGLEVSLFKSLTSKKVDGEDGADAPSAASLLKQYGSAYLLTSIPLSLLSFSICYTAISAGLDPTSVLSFLHLQPSETSETATTVAIAYATHKALSPVRFPPTVALTPVVAGWLGKKGETKDEGVSGEGEKESE